MSKLVKETRMIHQSLSRPNALIVNTFVIVRISRKTYGLLVQHTGGKWKAERTRLRLIEIQLLCDLNIDYVQEKKDQI